MATSEEGSLVPNRSQHIGASVGAEEAVEERKGLRKGLKWMESVPQE